MATDTIRYGANNEKRWIRLVAPSPAEVEAVVTEFQLNTLVSEVWANTTSFRTAAVDFESAVLIDIIMPTEGPERAERFECALILMKDAVVTMLSAESDLFSAVEQRLAPEDARIRRRGSDALLFRLLEAALDHLEKGAGEIDEALDDLEESVLSEDSDEVPSEVHELSRAITRFRRSVRRLADHARRVAPPRWRSDRGYPALSAGDGVALPEDGDERGALPRPQPVDDRPLRDEPQ